QPSAATRSATTVARMLTGIVFMPPGVVEGNCTTKTESDSLATIKEQTRTGSSPSRPRGDRRGKEDHEEESVASRRGVRDKIPPELQNAVGAMESGVQAPDPLGFRRDTRRLPVLARVRGVHHDEHHGRCRSNSVTVAPLRDDELACPWFSGRSAARAGPG